MLRVAQHDKQKEQKVFKVLKIESCLRSGNTLAYYLRGTRIFALCYKNIEYA
jgi:hypothetical protein